jgi:hypothetical protein
MARISALIAVMVTAIAVTVGVATAGRSTATLSVSFGDAATASATTDSVPYGTGYVVSGCGYAKGVGVTVVVHSPEAISFAGQLPDTNGCIAVSNFSTQGPGHYDLEAWQKVRNKSKVVATTYFDLS